MMDCNYPMLKCTMFDQKFVDMGFTDMAYFLVYLYRKQAGPYGVIRVDTDAESEEDVEQYFGRYRETLSSFGIVGSREPAPMEFQYLAVLGGEDGDSTLAEMERDGLSSDYLVIDKPGFGADDYRECKEKFVKAFRREPTFFQNVSKVSVHVARPGTAEEFENFIRSAGKIPVNVTDVVEEIAEVVDESTPFNLVRRVDEKLQWLNSALGDPGKVGFFTPSMKAERYSVGEILSMLFFLEHGRTLEYSTHSVDWKIFRDLTPRGQYALLECKVKFHMEYPKIALYVGGNIHHLCMFENTQPTGNRVPLYFFKMSALENGTARVGYGEFPLGNLRIVPILKYFDLNSNDISVCKEGNKRFSKCAAVIDKALHGNLASTTLNKCLVFMRDDVQDGEIYFGYCKDNLDVEVPVWLAPISRTPVDPWRTKFKVDDFLNLFSVTYISDLDVQLKDPESDLSRVLVNMKQGIERSIRGKYKGRSEQEIQRRVAKAFSFNRYTFYENPGFDRRAYLYNTGMAKNKASLKMALNTKVLDIASICAYSDLQKDYQTYVVPNLAKVFSVQRLRDLNYISAFGGYVPGICDQLHLTDSTLKGDGLYGYSDID